MGQDPAEAVDRMRSIGATHIELMLDGGYWNDFHLKMDDLIAKLHRDDVCYAVHTPVWEANLTCENSHIRAAVLETYKQTIVFAAGLGASHVVIHPGFCNASVFDKTQARQRAAQAIEELFEFNRPYGLTLLIENVGSNATSLYTMEEYIEYCNSLPPEGGALIDVGHAYINGWDFETLLGRLGNRLVSMHLHDNNGSCDSHSPIGAGTIEWEPLLELVRRQETIPELILEYNIGTPLEKLAEGLEFLQSRM